MKRLFLLLLAISPALFAQTSVTGRITTGPFAQGPGLPIACSPSDQWNTTDGHGAYICITANTWQQIGGGGTNYQLIQTASSPLPTRPTLNFPSNMTCVDNAGNNSTDCTPSANYQTIQNNAVSLAQEPKFNVVPPLLASDNGANTRTDISCPAAVGVGGSHASGCVPDPGASGVTTDYLGRDMLYHTSGAASTVKPDPSTGIMFVAKNCNGGGACSDSNDGLSWGTAKQTIVGALCALPGGNCGTSPQQAGNGTVIFADGVLSNVSSSAGIWVAGTADSQYASLPAGWMKSPTSGNFNLICDSLFTGAAHSNKPTCTVTGPTTGNLPLIWLSGTVSPVYVYGLTNQSGSPKWGNIGMDSSGSLTSGGSQVVSVTIENSNSNLPAGQFAAGKGPQLTVGNVFWVHIHDSGFGANLSETSAISTVSRSSNVVTVTTTSTCPFLNGDNISIWGVTDTTFNATVKATSSCSGGSTFTFAQTGPNATSSGGESASDRAFAIVLYGSQIEMARMHEENGGGIKYYPQSNGNVELNDTYMEGSGSGTMPMFWSSALLGGGGSADIGGLYMADTPLNPSFINEATALFVHSAFSQSTQAQGGAILASASDAKNRTTSLLASGQSGWYDSTHFESQNDIARRQGGPTSVNYPNLAQQIPAGWTNTINGISGSGYTTTAGKQDPFGGTGAYEIDSSSGSIGVNLYSSTSPIAVNDAFYFGGWVKAPNLVFASNMVGFQFGLQGLGFGAGNLCYGGLSLVNVLTPSIGDGNWFWVTGSCKIWANPAATPIVGLSVLIDNTHPVQIYRPWFIKVPAGTATASEITALVNSIGAGYSVAAVAGDIALAPSQRLCLPSGSTTNEFCSYLTHSNTANRSYSFQDAAGTIPTFSITPVNNDCVKWVVAGGVSTLGDAGAACGSGGGGGNVTNALLNSFAIYTGAGTTNQIGGVAGPLTPASVTQYVVYTPNGSVSGAPTVQLAGIPVRTNSSNGDTIFATDRNSLVMETFGGSQTVNVSSGLFNNGFAFKVGARTLNSSVAVTPSTGTCNGGSACTLVQGQNATFTLDAAGTNLLADVHDPPLIAGSGIGLTRGDYGLTITATGAVGSTGSPLANELACWSAATTITNCNLSGDATTSNTAAVTVAKVNGTTYPAGGALTTNTVPVVTGASAVTYEVVPAAALVGSGATTPNGQTCTLGSTCNVNVGAATHGIALNEGNGNAISGIAALTVNQIPVGVASADPVAGNLSELSATLYAADTGAVNVLTACSTPAAAALHTGQVIEVLPNHANTTGAPTLNWCTQGAKTITSFGTTLNNNDLLTTANAIFMYDGTNMELLNPQTNKTATPPTWDAIGSAANNMSISNAAFTTTFNQTSNVVWLWANTTSATVTTPQPAPLFTLSGQYWNGSASAADNWRIRQTLAAGTNGTSTLVIDHSTGSASNIVSIPESLSTTQLTSTVSTGTPPLVVSSTTKVTNLNSDTTDGISLGTPTAGGIGYGTSSTAIGTTAVGTAKQIVLSGGASAPTMITFPDIKYAPAANCVNGTAGSAWSTGATPAAICRAGTNNKNGLLSPWGSSDVGYIQFHIPADADLTTQLPSLMLEVTTTESNTHTIIMQEAVSCAKEDGSTTDDVAFNAARSFATVTETSRANQVFDTTITLNSTDLTGCAAPGIMTVKISRTTDTATNVGVYGLNLTTYRLLTVQAN